eukprot:1207035-Heterocapsa_arctica.AAC.1
MRRYESGDVFFDPTPKMDSMYKNIRQLEEALNTAPTKSVLWNSLKAVQAFESVMFDAASAGGKGPK